MTVVAAACAPGPASRPVADAANGSALLEQREDGWRVTLRSPLWQLGKVKRGETRSRVDAELRFSGVR